MKIGLLTYHDTTNYGATLQCYALAKAVSGLGYECEVIDYQCEEIVLRELPHIRLNGTLRNFVGSVVRFPKRWIKHKNLQRFLRRDLSLSKKYTRKNISDSCDNYDFFLVGSDILWSLDINGYDYTYFLDFLRDDSKKVSYATSSGEAWKDCDVPKLQDLISKFKKISVRESETADFLAHYIKNEISVVCDPTMLLTRDYWISLIKNTNKKKDYVLVYFPTEKSLADAERFAYERNLEVKMLRASSPMEEFFSSIYNAACVFTGSYHGLLFSIYFHTPFFYYNFQDKYRMEFLEKKFPIKQCNATETSEITEKNIDWSAIDFAINEYRRQSFEYLERCFKK